MTKIDFGFPLEDYADQLDESTDLLTEYLNYGHLGLLLGAGTSIAFGLPTWGQLVVKMNNDPSTGLPALDEKGSYTTAELKAYSSKIKRIFNGNIGAYIELIKKHLYEGVSFDFRLKNKDLLIALAALSTGIARGTVNDIITYNFDSVLEWYYFTVGLEVSVLTKSDLLVKPADVNITHIHGYLPSETIFGETSTDIVFTQQEFEDRLLSEDDFWKNHLYEFFKRHIFLTVGLSPSSIINDIIPLLRQTSKWYIREKVHRMMPYGIALVPLDTTPEDMESMIYEGVIPCKIHHDEIPNRLFEISKRALSLRKKKA